MARLNRLTAPARFLRRSSLVGNPAFNSNSFIFELIVERLFKSGTDGSILTGFREVTITFLLTAVVF
jgi:hypothetical protein